MSWDDTTLAWWAYGPAVLDRLFGEARCLHVSVCYSAEPPPISVVRAELGLSPAQTLSLEPTGPAPIANVDLLRLSPSGIHLGSADPLTAPVDYYALELVGFELPAADVIRLDGLIRAYRGLRPSAQLLERIAADLAYLESVRGTFGKLDDQFEAWRSTVR